MQIQCHVPINPLYAAFFKGDKRLQRLAFKYAETRGYPVEFKSEPLPEWEESISEQLRDLFIEDRINVDFLAQLLQVYQQNLSLLECKRLDTYYLFTFA